MSMTNRALEAFEAAQTAAAARIDELEGENREITADEQSEIDGLIAAVDAKRSAYESAKATDAKRSSFNAIIRPSAAPVPVGEVSEINESIRSFIEEGENRATITLDTAWKNGEPQHKDVISLGDTGLLARVAVENVPQHIVSFPVQRFSDATFVSTAEGVAVTETSGVANATLTTVGYKAGVVTSYEFENRVSDVLGKMNRVFTAGANRVLNAAVASVLTAIDGADMATPSALSGDDFIDLMYSVTDSSARAEMIWVIDPATLALVRKLVDDNGNYIYARLADGTSSLLGAPVFELGLQAPTTDGNLVAAFLHPEAITVAASDLRIDKSDQVRFDQAEYFYRGMIWAGAVVNDSAYVKGLDYQAA